MRHAEGVKVNEYQVGDKIRFVEERRSYTVRARSDRYLVCTKPFPLHKTVLYTIVDFQEQVRGTENLVFGLGAETEEQCAEMIERLEGRSDDVQTEVSHRNRVLLKFHESLRKQATRDVRR